MRVVETFESHLQQPDASVELLAFDIAAVAAPHLDVAAQLARIDLLAQLAGARFASSAIDQPSAAEFLRVFTGDLAFAGNQDDYYDPRNSLLDAVIERRTGLPIMLCLLCIAIGRRLGLRVDGLGFPNHFMARYIDDEGEWLIDPFHNAVVAAWEAEEYLASVVGRRMTLTQELFEPVTARDMALRILNNLRAAYFMRSDVDHLLDVLRLQAVMVPENPHLWRDRAVLHFRQEAWEEAAHDLRRYFSLLGALPHLFPEDVQSAFDLSPLDSEDRKLVAMHRRITHVLNHLN